MLTRLYLKNWRSLREQTIDLTPITVFVGANSSGKTNILDALHFLRRSSTVGANVALYNWQGLTKIRHASAALNEPVELEFRVNWLGDGNFSFRELIIPNKRKLLNGESEIDDKAAWSDELTIFHTYWTLEERGRPTT